MKIRILNAESMGVEDNLENGQVVDVEDCTELSYKYRTPTGGWHYLLKEWEGGYFKIVEEEPEMTTFKKMKMRINNPEHSKAVQEWLFEQGYGWCSGHTTAKHIDEKFIFTGTFSKSELTMSSSHDNFQSSDAEEINVQHLDPHLFTAHKSSKVPAKSFTAKSQQSTFDNMLKNLKHVQKAIEMADNKQSKRLKDRDRMMSKINEMLPEGFVVQVSEEGVVKFDPEDIVERSVWKLLSKDFGDEMMNDTEEGGHYKVHCINSDGSVLIVDDVNDWPEFTEEKFRKHFKRIS